MKEKGCLPLWQEVAEEVCKEHGDEIILVFKHRCTKNVDPKNKNVL